MTHSLIIVLSLLVMVALPGGLIAIEDRDVKNHQFRMILGTISLGLLVLLYVLLSWFSVLRYAGFYQGAYWLLWWVTVGVGLSGMILTWLAIWAMLERAWDLHRRAGMFGFVSGTVSGCTALLSTMMILFL